jgi:hypothetical protein
MFGLCNDASNSPDYIVPNCRIINDDNMEFGKDIFVTQLKTQTRDFPGRTK